jgi:hypothetical protein
LHGAFSTKTLSKQDAALLGTSIQDQNIIQLSKQDAEIVDDDIVFD